MFTKRQRLLRSALSNSRWFLPLVVGVLWLITAPVAEAPAESTWVVGRVEDFPPGSVTEVFVPLPFSDRGKVISPVPIYLVNHPQAGLLALYRWDAYGHWVVWHPATTYFRELESGAWYRLNGDVFELNPYSLARFGVHEQAAGQVVVDLDAYQAWVLQRCYTKITLPWQAYQLLVDQWHLPSEFFETRTCP